MPLVVDFMADDPDPDNTNMDITWSLGGPDAGDFTIVDGALTFKTSPNYEMPADADGDNVYEVTVAASDADSNRGEKSVEVKVANVDEDGTVTLSAVQPRVGVSLTASLTDARRWSIRPQVAVEQWRRPILRAPRRTHTRRPATT